MKNNTRQLIRDLKVAAVLGNPEAIDIALNGLLVFPGVAANDLMNERFIEKTIFLVGQLLARLKTSDIRPLQQHKLAAGRAVGAAALAVQYMTGGEATQKDLRRSANDPRLDVRTTLGFSLYKIGHHNPERLFMLCTAWLVDDSSKLRYTALRFIPALVDRYRERLVRTLDTLCSEPDWDVRTVLVGALSDLARSGLAESVLELLLGWSEVQQSSDWVISRVLSASWAAAYPVDVEKILQNLSSKNGASSQVKSAIEALARHGVEISL